MRLRVGRHSCLDVISAVTALGALAVVVSMVGYSVVAGNRSVVGHETALLPMTPVSLVGAVVRGSLSADVGVLQFSEFQCPYCAEFANRTFDQIVSRYVDSGQVLWAFRHLPLEGLHPRAKLAGAAAACAGERGRFWDMHDLLFRDRRRWAPDDLAKYAVRLGLDVKQFSLCLNGTGLAAVERDLEFGSALGIDRAPTFLLGTLEGDRLRVTRRIGGARDVDTFAAALEELLASVRD